MIGCSSEIRKQANGVKKGMTYSAYGISCITIGLYPCAIGGFVLGDLEGVEQDRKAQVAEKDAEVLKNVGGKKLEDSCWFFCD